MSQRKWKAARRARRALAQATPEDANEQFRAFLAADKDHARRMHVARARAKAPGPNYARNLTPKVRTFTRVRGAKLVPTTKKLAPRWREKDAVESGTVEADK